jgi:hypothetical protein
MCNALTVAHSGMPRRLVSHRLLKKTAKTLHTEPYHVAAI